MINRVLFEGRRILCLPHRMYKLSYKHVYVVQDEGKSYTYDKPQKENEQVSAGVKTISNRFHRRYDT